jgi:phosphocarrier protein
MAGTTNDNASSRAAQEACDTVTICNQRGLHARAAAKFVKLVAKFDAEVEVERNDMVVSGQSIMGLMMLAASQGCNVTLRAKGNQAPLVIAALVDLIGRKFDED